MEYVVRGIGLIESVKDIENIVLDRDATARRSTSAMSPAFSLGPEFRRGVLDKDGTEAVGGVVIMRYGANALRCHRGVKAKIARDAARPAEGRAASFRSTTAAR